MDVYREALRLIDQRHPCAVGIVTGAHGSTPQKPGSKALIDGAGRRWGTLGGGMVEAEAIAIMQQCLAAGARQLFEYRLDEKYSRDAGPICGGIMRIWIDGHPAAHRDAYAAALGAVEAEESGVLVTAVRANGGGAASVRWIPAGERGAAPDTLRTELDQCLLDETPRATTGAEGNEYFLEPIVARPRLLIVGGGHVGQAVAVQGVMLGFDVTVLDDREEFANPGLFPPEARTVCDDIREFVSGFPQDDRTYIVLVSKGHRPDAEALEGCIHNDARYIGMIGSKRKVRLLRKHFVEDGLATAAEFDRIVTPIGYDLGAVTVPEIGVAIAAQLVAARRNPEAVREIRAMALTGSAESRPAPSA